MIQLRRWPILHVKFLKSLFSTKTYTTSSLSLPTVLYTTLFSLLCLILCPPSSTCFRPPHQLLTHLSSVITSSPPFSPPISKEHGRWFIVGVTLKWNLNNLLQSLVITYMHLCTVADSTWVQWVVQLNPRDSGRKTRRDWKTKYSIYKKTRVVLIQTSIWLSGEVFAQD